MRNLEASCPLTSTLPNTLIQYPQLCFWPLVFLCKAWLFIWPETQGMRGKSLQQVPFSYIFLYHFWHACRFLRWEQSPYCNSLSNQSLSLSMSYKEIFCDNTGTFKTAMCQEKRGKLFGKLTLPQNDF